MPAAAIEDPACGLAPSVLAPFPLDNVAAPQETAKRCRRVLHLINGEHYSGAERVQDLLALRLPGFGYEVFFVCLKPGAFAARRRSQSSGLIELPMASRFSLAPVRAIAAYARQQRAEILHAHTPRSLMLGRLASAWTGLPLVYHVHSPTLRDSTRRIVNRLNCLVERVSLRRNVEMIAVSKSLGAYLMEQGLPQERITVVPNGVPSTASLPDRSPPTGQWTLGMAALFRPRKGLEVLLQALALLKNAGLDVRLRAIGGFETAEYEAKAKAMADSLGVAGMIDWLGFQQDVAAQFARLDLFVLPSLFGEGLPMVVLEAMSAGVPVVASRVEGAPEAIRDGVDGLLAVPNDAQALSEAILKVATGAVNWARIRESAWRRQSEQFSDRSMAAGVARVYDRLAADRPC